MVVPYYPLAEYRLLNSGRGQMWLENNAENCFWETKFAILDCGQRAIVDVD